MQKIVQVVLVALFVISCSPKIYSPQISSIPQTEEGTIYIRCSGMGTSKTKSYENAIYNALSTMIFQGVPESIQSRPMVPPEDANRERPRVNKCLNDNGCYKNFITQISPGDYTAVKGGYSTVVDVKINIVSLRSYMEQNSIIRKFGL